MATPEWDFIATDRLKVQSLTPLYGFLTDADRLLIGEEAVVLPTTDQEFEGFDLEDDFVKHIQLFQPKHLLKMAVTINRSQMLPFLKLADATVQGEISNEHHEFFYHAFIVPVSRVLRALHLFKKGRLVAGDTSFYVPRQGGQGTLSLVRCSEMAIDFLFLQRASAHYDFNSAEVPFFVEFYNRMNSLWSVFDKYPQLELAMNRYVKESASEGDPVDLISSLEGLLVQENEGKATTSLALYE